MRSQTNTAQDSSLGIKPSAPWRVETVSPLLDYCLQVRFVDGTEGVVDMSGLIFSHRSGIFSALRDKKLFAQVFVELGVVSWPGEIDLAPDAMYEEIKRKGKWLLAE